MGRTPSRFPLAAWAVAVLLTACGSSATDTVRSPTSDAIDRDAAPTTPESSDATTSDVPDTELEEVPTTPASCTDADAHADEATPVELRDAQFAFVGTVVSVADEVHPWTTDPENPERPAVATTDRWVTFAVEGWYTTDWGPTFSVWTPTVDVGVRDRVAVAGDAYSTEVADFSGQSGEVELCARVEVGEDGPPSWTDVLGAPIEPGPVVPTTAFEDRTIGGTRVFGEFAGPCPPTVLNNGEDDPGVAATGTQCFLAEVDAGRPVIWDIAFFTDEGDPIPRRYDFDGDRVLITTDYSYDLFGSGGVVDETCASVEATDATISLPYGVDCTTSDGDGFQADSLP